MTEEILISDMIENEDFRPLLEMYVAELPGRMLAINEALQNEDFETLRELAHQLKGSGGGYGYMPITDAAKAVEMAIKSGETEKASDLVAELERICEAAQRGLSQKT